MEDSLTSHNLLNQYIHAKKCIVSHFHEVKTLRPFYLANVDAHIMHNNSNWLTIILHINKINVTN